MIIILQWTLSSDPQCNLEYVREKLTHIRQHQSEQHLLVCLPEGFACFDVSADKQIEFAQNSQVFIEQVCHLANQYQVWISAGTIPVACGDKFYAASLLINHQGEVVARYNKIHLFDVEVADKKQHYCESQTTLAGQDVVVVATPFGKLGLTVCYDLRFPGLFGKLTALGAEIILVPSAFTVPTGKAHWHTLLRARAIENQVYIVAAASTGRHDRGRETFGHSLIVDPWGDIVAQLANTPSSIVYLPDMAKLAEIRTKMPVSRHNQFNYEFKHEQ